MNSTFVDSDVSAETETEVESTSATSSEVQSLSQIFLRKVVRPELGKISGIWWPDII
jgi:hypothetical protein